MDKLKLQLEHCYGIRKLDVVLNFDKSAAVAIYAPNGSMKSSLASTFQDIADGNASRDRIFPNRATVRVVQDENSADIGAVLVDQLNLKVADFIVDARPVFSGGSRSSVRTANGVSPVL